MHAFKNLLLCSFVLTTLSTLISAFSSSRCIPLVKNSSSSQIILNTHNLNRNIQLFARGVKKGSLRKNLENVSYDEIIETSSARRTSKPKTKLKPKGTLGNKQGNKSSGTISPSLAQWAASNQSSTTKTTSSTNTEDVQPDLKSKVDASEYTSFDDDKIQKKRKKKGKKQNASERRVRQAIRQKGELQMQQKIQSIASELEALLEVESNRDMSAIMGKISSLTDMSKDSLENLTTSMKILSSSQKRRDYRMIWAGSDDAICHVGTGLHKVPLARLQEVFVTIGKSRIEMYEVIRVLGPFPNVRNTLKGDINTIKPKQSSGVQSTLRISYDSMIDGTGKEILSGNEDNKRIVELRTRFASENIIICQTPSSVLDSNSNYDDDFGVNGSNLLVFALEEDMETKLEALRVA